MASHLRLVHDNPAYKSYARSPFLRDRLVLHVNDNPTPAPVDAVVVLDALRPRMTEDEVCAVLEALTAMELDR